jgi:hypothetical protein
MCPKYMCPKKHSSGWDCRRLQPSRVGLLLRAGNARDVLLLLSAAMHERLIFLVQPYLVQKNWVLQYYCTFCKAEGRGT